MRADLEKRKKAMAKSKKSDSVEVEIAGVTPELLKMASEEPKSALAEAYMDNHKKSN